MEGRAEMPKGMLGVTHPPEACVDADILRKAGGVGGPGATTGCGSHYRVFASTNGYTIVIPSSFARLSAPFHVPITKWGILDATETWRSSCLLVGPINRRQGPMHWSELCEVARESRFGVLSAYSPEFSVIAAEHQDKDQRKEVSSFLVSNATSVKDDHGDLQDIV
ncbi:hypothetical protein PM082_018696 [Marasmius tenuissimus]|nr:hypothetical protein PM082_018696 [Marasmius tenuissimus]